MFGRHIRRSLFGSHIPRTYSVQTVCCLTSKSPAASSEKIFAFADPDELVELHGVDEARKMANALLRAAHRRDRQAIDVAAKQAFESIDTNADNAIGAEEFTEWYRENVHDALHSCHEEAEECEITPHVLGLVYLRGMIPYIGFGVCDNALMIIFGDLIDQTLGVRFCLSTMAAAGLGNMISCTTGVCTGGVIDRWASALGLPVPNLTRTQQEMRTVRNASLAGSISGIILGCAIGMFPLLFSEHGFWDKDRLLHQQQQQEQAQNEAAAGR